MGFAGDNPEMLPKSGDVYDRLTSLIGDCMADTAKGFGKGCAKAAVLFALMHQVRTFGIWLGCIEVKVWFHQKFVNYMCTIHYPTSKTI